jgi:UDP-N-acetylmuramoyl-L-alanyl-D-glutamate--2,6-diaminopimelate ligase
MNAARDYPPPMQLAALIEAVEPLEVLGTTDLEITALTHRADDVCPGALHVCVPGATADGHDFAAAAVERGAAALIVERTLGLGVPELLVASAREAMPRVADRFFDHPSGSLDVVGVTGTNGKTTTAFLMHAVLAAAGRRPGLLGTVEQRVGGAVEPVRHTTPESIDLQAVLRRMVDAGDRSCAMEVSSHALHQHRADAVRFAAAGFTNLTQDHLDYHDGMEEYYLAKRRLFATGEWPAAVNIGDEYGRRLAAEAPGRVLSYEAGGETADVRPDRLEVGEGGAVSLIARTPRGLLPLDVRLRGHFNVANVLCAVALSELLELPHEAVRSGIAAVPGVPGRFEAVVAGQPFTVLVDYAHTPDSLDNVLRAARAITRGRLICVFGCGGDRDRGKRPLMGAVARKLADRAIVTTDNSRSEDPAAIAAEITAGFEMEVELDRRAAIERALAEAAEGDVVVIAGKGHEQGQQFADRTLPFDDRVVAREALEALAPR